MKLSTIIPLALAGVACVASAAAVDVVKSRQQNMKQVGGANKAIMDELRKPDGSVAVVQANARTLAQLAGHVPEWFPAGTGPDQVPTTKALPAIWQDPTKFRAASADFTAKARALVAAAAGATSLDQVRPAAMAVGGTCRGCHESFRARQQ